MWFCFGDLDPVFKVMQIPCMNDTFLTNMLIFTKYAKEYHCLIRGLVSYTPFQSRLTITSFSSPEPKADKVSL